MPDKRDQAMSDHDLLIRIDTTVIGIDTRQEKFEKSVGKTFATKAELAPVRRASYGIVGAFATVFILVVVGAILHFMEH